MIPIYVCCHNKCILPENELLVPIQAGRKIAENKLDMQGDDCGDNISDRNANYCELSVLYWVWRNTRHDCFGLCHYRRFFNLFDEADKLDSLRDFTAKSGHTVEHLNNLMQNYDLILPYAKTKTNGSSLYQLYASAHYISDMDLALTIISKVYPEMIVSAEKALFRQPRAYYKNMMIGRRNFYNAYCNWLFDILHRIDCLICNQLKKRNLYQQRVYGFLAERLFNVFLEHYCRGHSLRIKEVPLLFYSEQPDESAAVWKKVSNI